MNILLINPPFFDVYKGFQKAARIGASYPPTGLLYLAGRLLQDGHQVRIIDMAVDNSDIDDILSVITRDNIQLVGITATTPIFGNAAEIAGAIKKAHSIPIVVGGIHVTILRDAILRENSQFDYAVIGEGEVTLAELVRCLADNGDPAEVNGIVFRRTPGNDVYSTPPRPLLSDLDELPFPARFLVKKEHYLWTPPKQGPSPIASVITQRGCPFKCAFCSQHSMFTRKVRARSVDNVLDELEEIVNRQGIRHIMILDDTFVLSKERAMRICAGIKKRRLVFTWENMSRADLVDREVLETMADAGLVRMSFGIESGDQEILDRIHKGTTLEQIRQAYAWAKEAGIETRGSAIIGHPGETAKSAWKTIRFLRSLKELNQVYINIMVPYPGTEVYELAVRGEAGYRLLSKDFNRYIRYNESVLEVNDLDRAKLKRLQNIGLWMFYATPRRIIYNLFRSGLKNGVYMATAMLRGLFSGNKA